MIGQTAESLCADLWGLTQVVSIRWGLESTTWPIGKHFISVRVQVTTTCMVNTLYARNKYWPSLNKYFIFKKENVVNRKQ